jgi:S1-C subfamily serine protease
LRCQLLHLSGPLRGRTATYLAHRITVGSAPGSVVRFPAGPPLAPRHAEISFVEPECQFHLKRGDGQVFVNGREVEEVILEPDDVIEFGRDGPEARFRIHMESGAVCKPVRQMLGDARVVGSVSGVSGFFRSFVRDLFTHATLTLKIGFPIAVLAIVGTLAFLGGWLGTRRPLARLESRDAERARVYQEDLARVRRMLEAYRARQETLVAKDDVERIRAEFGRRAEVVDRLVRENEALRVVLEIHSRSVCLVHGIVGFAIELGGTTSFLSGTDGQRLELEYLGSGFVAGRQGLVVTNRHVLQPWWNNAQIESVMGLGYEPRFLLLEACFPGRSVPVALDPGTITVRTDEVDVATVTADDIADVPPLPLDDADPRGLRGQRVVVLGYPTGIGALLAKADVDVARAVRAAATTMTEVIVELAKRDAISPIATQGALNDVLGKQLVYDAETTAGGSGGPVFGVEGRVIGVTFAGLTGFGGSNFGVPIRYARELIK